MNNSERNPSIAYPGITAEIVGNGKNIYEPNFNCGGVSALLLGVDKIENSEDKKLILAMVIEFFEKVKLSTDKLIFITDQNLIMSQTLHNILKNIFGENDYKIIGTAMANGYTNSLSGAQVRDSIFSDEDKLTQTIKDHPEALVLSSIPYSDPRVNHLLERLNGYEETTSYKSLQLININSDRQSHIKVAKEEIGNKGIIFSRGEIFDYVEKNKILVLKTLQGSAGGTAVDFLLNEEQIIKFDNTANRYPYLVNEFIEPRTLDNSEGKFPFHIRPFFDGNGNFLGCALKITQIPLVSKLGSGKSAFSENGKGLNTSAGLSKSIFINTNGVPVIGFVDKNSQPLNSYECMDFIKTLSLDGKKINGEILADLAKGASGLIKNIQEKTNQLLGLK